MPPVLTLVARRVGAATVVSARGDIHVGTFDQAKEALARAGVGDGPLVLDLREVEFMDTSGLRLIMDERERAAAGGYRFAVVRGPRRLQRLFDLAGFQGWLDLFVDDPAEVADPADSAHRAATSSRSVRR